MLNLMVDLLVQFDCRLNDEFNFSSVCIFHHVCLFCPNPGPNKGHDPAVRDQDLHVGRAGHAGGRRGLPLVLHLLRHQKRD